jgi:pimeloyl-ACP methyl ester carboxylesterase
MDFHGFHPRAHILMMSRPVRLLLKIGDQQFMRIQSVLKRVFVVTVGVYCMNQGIALAADQEPVKNIVLVHGAWADGSSWAKIIPLLEKQGLHVVAVQNPLSSLADDVAATKRAIDAQDGPVLLVGHSYGGAVITEAGNNSKVARLVYVAAFGPDTGESLGTTAKDFAPPAVAPEVKPTADNFLVLTKKGVTEDFAQDLSPAEKQVLVATQAPTAAAVFGAPMTDAAWRHKPTWYVVAENDRMINPDYERFAAKRMGAKTLVLPTSHVPMLSKPKEVAAFIAEAASGK